MEEKNKQKKKQVFAQARLGVGTRVWTVGRAGEKEAGLGVWGGGRRMSLSLLPSAPWEVRSSAFQRHEGHHLLQFEGQPLLPGRVVLLQCADNLTKTNRDAQKSASIQRGCYKNMSNSRYFMFSLTGNFKCTLQGLFQDFCITVYVSMKLISIYVRKYMVCLNT